ncbi:MAG: cytochrome c oxidase subunit 3 [Guyparkeria sp.]
MTTTASPEHYYVPHETYWPLIGTVGLFLFAVGGGAMLNGMDWGAIVLLLGVAVVIGMTGGWFAEVIHESEHGYYSAQVDRSFRQGMLWFIFSEVMFFGAFFGALFYVRTFAVPWLGGSGDGAATHEFLHQGFQAAWPTHGPAALRAAFETVGAWGLPALNTAILLASGVTITFAHWSLKRQRRKALVAWMLATMALGAVFVFFQVEEYLHAWKDLNLTLNSGIYGSTFYMLTGFHGLHVTLGVIMLAVITLRCALGHFTPKQHFGWEAVAWYWHFVDVVWLILFVFVYWI